MKGLISNMWLILLYTVNLDTKSEDQNFICLHVGQALAEKSLTEDVHMHYIGVRDGKKKEKVW